MQLSLSEALYYNQFTCLVYLQFRHLGQGLLAFFAGNALEQISLGLSKSFPQRLPREAFHASSPRPAVKVTFLHLTSQCFLLLQSSHYVEVYLHVYLGCLMVHSMGTRLEFMPSANGVPKLFCERMNHVSTGLKRLTGKILEHWGSSIPS